MAEMTDRYHEQDATRRANNLRPYAVFRRFDNARSTYQIITKRRHVASALAELTSDERVIADSKELKKALEPDRWETSIFTALNRFVYDEELGAVYEVLGAGTGPDGKERPESRRWVSHEEIESYAEQLANEVARMNTEDSVGFHPPEINPISDISQ